METWITDIIEQFGYIGVFFMIAIENIFPPIPSEVILTFSGMMTAFSNLTIMGVVLSATAGSVLGAVVLYLIGSILDVPRLEKIVDRYGKILRVTKEDIHKAVKWFDTYGIWTVFLCRFIPLIRSLISIPAGMSKMKWPVFLFFTTIGTFIWNLVLVTLGAKFGQSWEIIVHYMDIYSNIVYFIIAMAFIIFVIYLIKRKGNNNV